MLRNIPAHAHTLCIRISTLAHEGGAATRIHCTTPRCIRFPCDSLHLIPRFSCIHYPDLFQTPSYCFHFVRIIFTFGHTIPTGIHFRACTCVGIVLKNPQKRIVKTNFSRKCILCAVHVWITRGVLGVEKCILLAWAQQKTASGFRCGVAGGGVVGASRCLLWRWVGVSFRSCRRGGSVGGSCGRGRAWFVLLLSRGGCGAAVPLWWLWWPPVGLSLLSSCGASIVAVSVSLLPCVGCLLPCGVLLSIASRGGWPWWLPWWLGWWRCCARCCGCPCASLGFVCGSPCRLKSARLGLLACTGLKALNRSGLLTFPKIGAAGWLGGFPWPLLSSCLFPPPYQGGGVAGSALAFHHRTKFRKFNERRGAVAFVPGCFSYWPVASLGVLPLGAWVVPS